MGDQGIECAVEYDYTAELGDELTLRVGDVITHVEKMEGGWWRGRLRGVTGMFPDNFVKVLPGTPTVPLKEGEAMGRRRCKVLFSYSPAHDDELELQVDDWVDYLCEVEDGWYKGRLKGRVGVFPSNFVELCNAEAENNHANTVHEKNKKNSLQGSMANGTPSVLTNTTNKILTATDSNKISSADSKIKSADNKAETTRIQDNKLTDAKKDKEEVIHETPKKTNSANNPPGSKSMTTSERQLRNSGPAPDTAPRLPPKPVKEQCVVLFPYTAQNEDELSLVEGQTINILSRDIEDKGWWKGELDGLVGVFPDNFVKLLPQDNDEGVDKKPHRPPTSSEHINVTTGSSTKLNRSNSSVKDSQRATAATGSTEKLAKKVNDLFRKSHSGLISDNSGGGKKPYAKSESDTHLITGGKVISHSKSASSDSTAAAAPFAGSGKFETAKANRLAEPAKAAMSESDGSRYQPTIAVGVKSPAPTRPPPPSSSAAVAEPPTPAVNLANKFGLLTDDKAKDDVTHTPADKGLLETVNREVTLTSVTAKRVKGPSKRRPPSSVFLKENIPDLVEIPVESEEEVEQIQTSKNADLKDRIEGKSVLENTPNTSVHIRDKGKIGLPVFPGSEGTKEEAQKPSWLEELSRKQANRKSGIFSEEKKPELPSPDNKPIIPSKPSDNRKSLGSFSRRPNSFADKSNKAETDSRPARPAFPVSAASGGGLAKSSSSSQLPDNSSGLVGGLSSGSFKEKSSRTRKISDSAKKQELTGSSSSEKIDEKSSTRKPTESRQSDRKAAKAAESGGRKQSDLSRKGSDSGKASSSLETTSATSSAKPSVHSTNLGKPAGHSFASVPERPADLRSTTDLARTSEKSSSVLRRGPSTSVADDHSSSGGEPSTAVSKRNETEVAAGAVRPARANDGETAAAPTTATSIGWAPHIFKGDNNKASNTSVEAQLLELRDQLSSLKQELDQEKAKRIDLEAEVYSLRRLVMSRKE